MGTRINFLARCSALAAMAFAPGGQAAGSQCEPAPAVVQAFVQSGFAAADDVNGGLWQRVSRCDWLPISDDSADRTISQFAQVARDNGLAGGLRTFARNEDFRLYLEGMNAMPMGVSNEYLNHHPLVGMWKELARGRSADSTLLFATGEVLLSRHRYYQFVEVWQFDSKVANWGVKLLMLKPATKE